MTFFSDYNNIRCDEVEFNLIKESLDKDGWSWYLDGSLLTHTPRNLALIEVKTKKDKTLIPYFVDEIEYIEYQKDVKEIIRELKLKDLDI